MDKCVRAALVALLPVLLYITNAGAITCAPYYGQNYKEDFNSLASSGVSDVLPLGWGFTEQGLSNTNNTTYTASDGSSSTPETYSFGNSSERALGEISNGLDFRSTVGVCLVNSTGAEISSFDVGYRAEIWRRPGGSCHAGGELRTVQYSLDATALDNGAWTNIDELGLIVELGDDQPAGPRNGNVLAVPKGPVTVSPAGVWSPGSTIFFRWVALGFVAFDCVGVGFGYDDFMLTTKKCGLDVDGNGSIGALTDGLILLRAMFGLTGSAATSGALAPNANRPNWTAIRGYLNDSCGTNFAP